MVQQINLPQPEQGVPGEQALVSPASWPGELAALHQQSSQAIHNECALIRQEIGLLKGELTGLAVIQTTQSGKIEKLERIYHIGIGIIIAASILMSIVWYLTKFDLDTLLQMAHRQQYLEFQKSEVSEKSLQTNK
jgi:hypothetical protein